MTESIHEYWEERARKAAASPTATTDDVYLRELEVGVLVRAIRDMKLTHAYSVLDLGCGDGYSTLRIAEQLPGAEIVGVDYSASMIATANERLRGNSTATGKLSFRLGDATEVGSVFPASSFDVVMTDRCLINIPMPEQQYRAIRQIHEVLRPGGRYLAIENFHGGQDELNRTRAAVGLPEIPIRWHNRFFHEDEFLSSTRALFREVEIVNFASAYYYATRVVYSKYCQLRGEKPDYRHEIHQLAIELPPIGNFSPIKLVTMQK
jgi:ubiquinone/menaquinone biosynthesis C-methylase UbiE